MPRKRMTDVGKFGKAVQLFEVEMRESGLFVGEAEMVDS